MTVSRCTDCRRVRYHNPSAGPWVIHRQPILGEVRVICRRCLDYNAACAEGRRELEGLRLLQDRKRGYGPAPEGEDVFKEFRKGE